MSLLDKAKYYSLIETIKAGDAARKEFEELVVEKADQAYLVNGCSDSFSLHEFNFSQQDDVWRVQFTYSISGGDYDSISFTVDEFFDTDFSEKAEKRLQEINRRDEKLRLLREAAERAQLAKLKAKYEQKAD
jgi:hypothetical protein